MFKLKSLFSIIAALAIVFCAVADSASAQAPGAPSLKPRVYLGGGSFAVTGPSGAGDVVGGSYSFMGAVGLPLSMGIELMGKVHYHKFSTSTVFLSLSPLTDPEFNSWTYGVDAKYPFIPGPSPAKPYALGGIGAYSFSSDTWGGSTSGMFYNIGAGLDISVGPSFSLFGEAKYTSLNGGSGLNILPFVVGVRVM